MRNKENLPPTVDLKRRRLPFYWLHLALGTWEGPRLRTRRACRKDKGKRALSPLSSLLKGPGGTQHTGTPTACTGHGRNVCPPALPFLPPTALLPGGFQRQVTEMVPENGFSTKGISPSTEMSGLGVGVATHEWVSASPILWLLGDEAAAAAPSTVSQQDFEQEKRRTAGIGAFLLLGRPPIILPFVIHWLEPGQRPTPSHRIGWGSEHRA